MGTHYFVAIKGEWAEEPSELAAALRADLPGSSVELAVFNDSTATPVYVEPGMTVDKLLERVLAADAE